MRKVETTVYDYKDMVALREMTPKEAMEAWNRRHSYELCKC